MHARFLLSTLTLTLLALPACTHAQSSSSNDKAAQLFLQNTEDKASFTPNSAQKITARQIAFLLDKAHYLKQPLDEAKGRALLNDYINTLDPNNSFFLQSDVDEFVQKYAHRFAKDLKQGDLMGAIAIFERYRTRSNQYYESAKAFLSSPNIDLNTNESIILDREKLPRFKSKDEQYAYWQNQVRYTLINATLHQEDENAIDQVFLNNPTIAQGQDLVKAETRTPAQVLLNRINRQQAQLWRLSNDEILESILNSAMMSYDPHSNYYAPVQATQLQIDSNLQLEGIGVSIRPDRKNPDYTRIATIIDGGPAAKTGQVRPNDIILAVAQDGEAMIDTVGYSTREIVALIRGKKGSVVTIRLKQPNDPDSAARNVTITRDIIEQDESGVHHRIINVNHHNKDYRIGVLEIPSFYINFQARRQGQKYRSVSEDTKNALAALNAQNIDGLVIDLRANPGGSLDEVNKMIGMFIKQGAVVQVRDNQGDIQVYTDNDGGKQLYQKDLVVLTDLASASASEIFAAAMQDYGRGLIVGSTTTGKGSAQVQLNDISLGSATLTQRKFYRITGGSTQNKGVIPDVSLVNIYEDSDFGERAYKNPLPWDTISAAPFKPEGRYSKATLETLQQQSDLRQKTNAQFIYLDTLNKIRQMDDDKAPKPLNIDARRALDDAIEAKTLQAENTRRVQSGEDIFDDWSTYQAHMDALFETRSTLKQHERPKLPENEAFIIEAAKVMLDAKALQVNN